MSLSDDDVRHVAKLAALELSDEEISEIKKDLNEILDYIGALDKVSTDSVAPTSHVHGVVNAFREDILRDSYPTDVLEGFAPDYVEGGFRVPKVVS